MQEEVRDTLQWKVAFETNVNNHYGPRRSHFHLSDLSPILFNKFTRDLFWLFETGVCQQSLRSIPSELPRNRSLVVVATDFLHYFVSDNIQIPIFAGLVPTELRTFIIIPAFDVSMKFAIWGCEFTVKP
ncbi:hypothetical protein J7T55_010285 [Diaporthe amygdali]|uniref:uncharacterized protein n=1 Tax=Phomopsis amygdali TaxID=1214568 RepID=UPI0022FE7C6C|nr:uncharacterized protein J7T55_010285 [Diaporthe amygdali]KAJ0107679.1 hypothetical protein J7T55_010285 [Diaporthe amygdali]